MKNNDKKIRSGMGPNGPKMPIFGQKSQFWVNLAVYRPKLLIFTEVSTSFSTSITEKSPMQLVPIVFWSGIESNGQKMPVLGTKMCNFDPKIWIFGAKSQSFVKLSHSDHPEKMKRMMHACQLELVSSEHKLSSALEVFSLCWDVVAATLRT